MGEVDYRVEEGWRFPRTSLTIARDYQDEQHRHCDIAQATYGERADTAFLARYPIREIGKAIFQAHPERGYVHTIHRIHQYKPLHTNRAYEVDGMFSDVEDVPRGWMLSARFDYRDADGSLALRVEPRALMADPTRMPDKKEKSSGGSTAVGTEGFETITRKQCTPEKTLGYCADSDNKIHTDPDYARGFGFRAPIIAGNQIVNYLLEALALDGVPDEMDVEIQFRRPVFWDDTVTIEGRRENGRLRELRAVKEDGRVAATCQVFSIG